MELGKMRLILNGFEDGLKAYTKTAAIAIRQLGMSIAIFYSVFINASN